MTFYRESLEQASERHRAWAADHYATVAVRRPSEFWQTRAETPLADDVRSAVMPREDVGAQMASGRAVAVSSDVQFLTVPRLGDEFVSVGPAIAHPLLDGPVAFVGGWELAPLLREVRAGMTPLEVVHVWKTRMPVESGIALAGWMLGRRILVPMEGAG